MGKRIILGTLVVASVLAGVTAVQASDALKAIVGSYLEIQAKLATDKVDGIKPAAEAIAAQAARLGTDGDALVKSATAVAAATDLKTARTAFGDLSDAVIAAGKADGWKDVPEVKVAYCPMVKKSWVQKEAEIRNPYYGTAMLTCGTFTK